MLDARTVHTVLDADLFTFGWMQDLFTLCWKQDLFTLGWMQDLFTLCWMRDLFTLGRIQDLFTLCWMQDLFTLGRMYIRLDARSVNYINYLDDWKCSHCLRGIEMFSRICDGELESRKSNQGAVGSDYRYDEARYCRWTLRFRWAWRIWTVCAPLLLDLEAQTGMCQWLTYTFENSCGCSCSS